MQPARRSPWSTPKAATKRLAAEANENPKSFVWTADPDEIIAIIRPGYHASDPVYHHLDKMIGLGYLYF